VPRVRRRAAGRAAGSGSAAVPRVRRSAADRVAAEPRRYIAMP